MALFGPPSSYCKHIASEKSTEVVPRDVWKSHDGQCMVYTQDLTARTLAMTDKGLFASRVVDNSRPFMMMNASKDNM